ncbi:uncharacterized protein LOC108109786 [Drosophila eugracilis]|uniref:uncharacterized protein LOC108109786 n=1 Tax=Drosophila eugracilis TaxID=29029 RepID=UPI0007E83BCE|nr:uncharacterized protein LOC108109786 [Drosophila eugracilis]
MLKSLWLLTTLSNTAGSFYNRMQCSNCSKINRECSIETTGWSCEFELDARKLVPNSNSTETPEFLKACLLSGMGFKGERPIMGYCCFWSPEMGCQKLQRIDSNVDSVNHCYGCTRTTWSSVMENKTCPCGSWFIDVEDSAVKFRVQGIVVLWLLLRLILYFIN